MQILIQWVWAVPDSGFLTFLAFPGDDDVTSIQLYIYNMAATYFPSLIFYPSLPSTHVCMFVTLLCLQVTHMHTYTQMHTNKIMGVCVYTQSCPAPGGPVDCSLSGFSVHGISQAKILEWVAMPSSRGSSRPRDQTRVSSISCIGRLILYHYCHLGSPP